MVVIVTQIMRDPNDNAILTVEYDINGVMQAPKDMDYSMQNIMNETPAEIKQNLLDWVAVQRGDDLWASVQAKTAQYIGQDIE